MLCLPRKCRYVNTCESAKLVGRTRLRWTDCISVMQPQAHWRCGYLPRHYGSITYWIIICVCHNECSFQTSNKEKQCRGSASQSSKVASIFGWRTRIMYQATRFIILNSKCHNIWCPQLDYWLRASKCLRWVTEDLWFVVENVMRSSFNILKSKRLFP